MLTPDSSSTTDDVRRARTAKNTPSRKKNTPEPRVADSVTIARPIRPMSAENRASATCATRFSKVVERLTAIDSNLYGSASRPLLHVGEETRDVVARWDQPTEVAQKS